MNLNNQIVNIQALCNKYDSRDLAELIELMQNCLETLDICSGDFLDYLPKFEKSYPKWIAYHQEQSEYA